MIYRKEIDGLRAMAVLPVILFHAGIHAFGGGFVGVDVFFVISGYLITSIILSEKQQGTFTLVGFYERRARRILPALLFVMLACLPVAWFWLVPRDMKDFSESLLAVSVFASNILFWRDSGYFATAAELRPLLHTWSLAVEEQYYLLFPLFLLSTWRLGIRWIVGILVVVAALSLVLAQWGSHNYPEATFYLAPTRGWELLIGAFIAFLFTQESARNRLAQIGCSVREWLSIGGLLLITYGVLAFDRTTPFPSVLALVPTLGTALVIMFATPDVLAGRVLGSKILAGTGLISYGAYLWHYPLFAFARLLNPEPVKWLVFLLLAVCSLGLAYLSWRYIECPFRDRKRISRKSIFILGFSVSAVAAAAGLYGHVKDGYVFGGYYARIPVEQKEVASFLRYPLVPASNEKNCFLEPDQDYRDFLPFCSALPKESSALLIWGDSHAASIATGLRSLVPGIVQLTASGCPPLVDTPFYERPHCRDINAFVLREVERIKPGRILLHARWSLYQEKDLSVAIARTIHGIRRLSPASRIYIVGSLPEWHPSLQALMLAAGMTLRKEADLHTPMLNELKAIDESIRVIAKTNNVSFLSVLESLCRAEACKAVLAASGKYEPIASDYGHLTESGSVLVAGQLLGQIDSK
jgi:peptidoglycan/LPS O-acetylase OafA/YrhL